MLDAQCTLYLYINEKIIEFGNKRYLTIIGQQAVFSQSHPKVILIWVNKLLGVLILWFAFDNLLCIFSWNFNESFRVTVKIENPFKKSIWPFGIWIFEWDNNARSQFVYLNHNQRINIDWNYSESKRLGISQWNCNENKVELLRRCVTGNL